MTIFLLTLVIVGTVLGDLLKAAAMRRLGEISNFGPRSLAASATTLARNAFIWLSIGGYAVSFFAFMALLSIEDVSFAVPATAGAYVVETLLARIFLKERISMRRYAAAVLVTCGVVLISW